MKIWHIYARNYNFGDHALGLAVRDLFRQEFGPKVIFETIDTHQAWFGLKDVLLFNNDADMLLIGGGGLIHAFNGKTWMLHFPCIWLKFLSCPLVIFSVGHNQFTIDGRLPKNVVRNLIAVKKKALSFTIRNDKSKELMANEGFDLQEIPDPGFFLDRNYPRPSISNRYIIVQLTGDASQARGLNDNAIWREIVVAIDALVAQGFSIAFCPHVKGDIKVTEDVISSLKSRESVYVWDYYKSISDDYISECLAYYKHAELVIAMRGHAQIIPYGMKIPFVTISNHRKHKDLAEVLGLGDYVYDVTSKEAKGTLQKIIALALFHKNEIMNQQEKGMEIMHETMREFFKTLHNDYVLNKKVKTHSFLYKLLARTSNLITNMLYK
jgi:polysaccharide pyruvyl transferase WcaK-like protein